MKKIISIILICFLFGCTSKFEPFMPEPINFPKTQKYSVEDDIKNINNLKPSNIKRMFGKITKDGYLEFVDDPKQAQFFILAPEELNKVNKIKEISKSYKAIIYKQEDLINLKNETINELRRLLILVERERDIALNGWKNSENSYRQEKREHRNDNIINKVSTYVLGIGTIILIATAL